MRSCQSWRPRTNSCTVFWVSWFPLKMTKRFCQSQPIFKIPKTCGMSSSLCSPNKDWGRRWARGHSSKRRWKRCGSATPISSAKRARQRRNARQTHWLICCHLWCITRIMVSKIECPLNEYCKRFFNKVHFVIEKKVRQICLFKCTSPVAQLVMSLPSE